MGPVLALMALSLLVYLGIRHLTDIKRPREIKNYLGIEKNKK